MSRRKPLWRLFFSLMAMVLLATGCSSKTMNIFEPKGSAGEQQLDLVMLSVYIMLFVFVVVIGIYIYVLVRYRQRQGDDVPPKQIEGNTMIEILWTAIPVVLLIILAIPTVSTTFSLAKEPAEDESIRVKVTAYQYWWMFEYPDLGIKTSQELHIPVGKKVFLELESKDVIHSFWVPNLGGKRDMIPGKTNTMTLDAKEPGVYEGRCAELCGAGHALMNFRVIAEEQNDFDKWVASIKNPKSQPVNAQAEEGQKIFSQNCTGCHAVEGADMKVKGDKAPDLTGFGNRTTIAGYLPNDKESLIRWLKDPQSVKPGTQMPAYSQLDKQKMDALAEYLTNLK